LSKVVTISKLEALLSRIRTRAAEPRSPRPAAHAAPLSAAAPPAPAAVAPTPAAAAAPAAAPAVAPVPTAAPYAPAAAASPAPPVAVVASPPGVAPAFAPVAAAAPLPRAAAPAPAVPPAPTVEPTAFVPPTPRVAREPSSPPPEGVAVDEPTLPPPPPASVSSDSDFAVDVEIPPATPSPAAVAASDGDEARDSRERLSAAPPEPLEPTGDSLDAGPSLEVEELAEVNEGGIPGDEDEEIEKTPASSRRPVTSPPEERLADLAFGTEESQPPRHTPPPKSGRLPAPPPGEFDPDVTGVRAAPVIASDDETMVSPHASEPSVLSAEAVRPNLGSGPSVHVVDVIGEAQRFAPATFLDLLDASLSL
jgi:hypothetical protein